MLNLFIFGNILARLDDALQNSQGIWEQTQELKYKMIYESTPSLAWNQQQTREEKKKP